jgi:uncharacterized membrane protein YgcG
LRELNLDLRLHPHVTNLFQCIRKKCMVQYLMPYVSVEMSKMNRQFAGCFPTAADSVTSNNTKQMEGHTDADALEGTLVQLMGRGEVCAQDALGSDSLGARINCRNKTVVLRRAVPCARRQGLATQQRIQLLSETFQRDTEALLLRSTCIDQRMMLSTEHHAGGVVATGSAGGSSSRGRGGRSRYGRGFGGGGGRPLDLQDDSSDEDGDGAFAVGFGVDDVPMEENGQDV